MCYEVEKLQSWDVPTTFKVEILVKVLTSDKDKSNIFDGNVRVSSLRFRRVEKVIFLSRKFATKNKQVIRGELAEYKLKKGNK